MIGPVYQTERLLLTMTSPQLAGRVADYYRRNRTFLTPFEPMREDAFFSEAGQRPLLLEEQRDVLSDRGYRFYIARREAPEEIIGLTSLGQIVRRAFQSCFLGYKLDQRFLRRGYMTEAVRETVRIAFEELDLHRIEANIMPRRGLGPQISANQRGVGRPHPYGDPERSGKVKEFRPGEVPRAGTLFVFCILKTTGLSQ